MKNKLIILLTVLIMAVLAGCGMSEEDAKAYVQASLDAAYKGEFEAFVEITDSTSEGAKVMYEENIEHTMEAAGFNDLNLSDELNMKYEQLFLNLAKAADYTVGEAIKVENDDFSVEVFVRPLNIFDGIDEEVTEALIERINKLEEHPDDKAIIEMSFEEMHRILSERIENPVYSEDQVLVSLYVYKNDEGMYAISEDDMLMLDNVFFTISE